MNVIYYGVELKQSIARTDAAVNNVVIGAALENGPAFSTNSVLVEWDSQKPTATYRRRSLKI